MKFYLRSHSLQNVMISKIYLPQLRENFTIVQRKAYEKEKFKKKTEPIHVYIQGLAYHILWTTQTLTL